MREPLERIGEEGLRRQVVAGGYRLIDRSQENGERVNIFVWRDHGS